MMSLYDHKRAIEAHYAAIDDEPIFDFADLDMERQAHRALIDAGLAMAALHYPRQKAMAFFLFAFSAMDDEMGGGE